MNKEALQLALEAFEKMASWRDGEVGSHMDEPYAAEISRNAITAIQQALNTEETVETKKTNSTIETLHALYEQASQQRDQLMDAQRAQVEAMRGRIQ